MWYSSRFADLKAKPPMPEPTRGLEISMLPLDQPIWTNGLGDVDWLLPERTPSNPQIAVLAFSLGVEPNELVHEGEALAGHEDESGRLSRAIPLHLTEVLRFRTDAAPTAGEAFQVELIVWQAGDDKPLARLASTPEECESALLDFLAGQKIVVRREPSPLFRVPKHFREYLAALGQLFALSVARWEMSDDLFGERNIHRWLLALALNDADSPVAKLGFAAALANSRRRGSDVYRELEKEALAMFGSVTPPDGDLHRITPVVFRLFDRMDEFEQRRNELMPGADDRYIRWLASLDTLFDPATES